MEAHVNIQAYSLLSRSFKGVPLRDGRLENLEGLVVIIYHRCVCMVGARAVCVRCDAVGTFPFLWS